jgi:hydroxyacylglutathione hydrolase
VVRDRKNRPYLRRRHLRAPTASWTRTGGSSRFRPPAPRSSTRRAAPVDRPLLSYGPAALYVTHFGRLTDLTALAADLHRLIDAHAELGERHRRAGAERKRLLFEGVRSLVLDERERQGWRLSREKTLEVFALDIELNAQGLASWLDAEGN